MNVSTIETYINIFAGITTIIAIIVGGYWSWRVFVRTRQKYPRAVLSHKISHLSLTPEKKLVHVDLCVQNAGDVIITVASWAVWIQQILPLDLTQDEIDTFIGETKTSGGGKPELPWYQIGKNINSRPEGKEMVIEPREIDHLYFDFVIDSEVEVVLVYSHIRNEEIKERPTFGWDIKTLANVKSEMVLNADRVGEKETKNERIDRSSF